MPPKIALPYRLYFLYIEPLSAFLGGIVAVLQPTQILQGTTPLSLLPLASAPPSPLTKILITNIASLYILFAWNQAVVLRVADGNLRVWSALLLGMVLCDLGHLYALFVAGPAEFLSFGVGWRASDWVNEGTLFLGLTLRVLFLMGVGVRASGGGLR